MKIWRLKINSSVVTVNLGVLLVTVGLYIAAWFTGNNELVNEIFGPQTAGAILVAMNVLTIILRNTGLKGLPPVVIEKPEVRDVQQE